MLDKVIISGEVIPPLKQSSIIRCNTDTVLRLPTFKKCLSVLNASDLTLAPLIAQITFTFDTLYSNIQENHKR